MSDAQRLVVDAEAVLDVGPIVLDQHVGGGRQLLQHRDRLGLLEIERHAALVAVQVEEVGDRRAARPSDPLSAPAGISILMNVRAPVGEVSRSRRPGTRARQVDHLEAGQRSLTL